MHQEITKIKKIVVFTIIISSLIYTFKHYFIVNDWSDVNKLIYNACIYKGTPKKECSVNFHKLQILWDKMYFFSRDADWPARNIYHLDLPISFEAFCDYLVLMKNNSLEKVYKQCYDSDYQSSSNTYNKIFVWNERTIHAQINEIEKFSLYHNQYYFKEDNSIIYEFFNSSENLGSSTE